MHSWGSHGIILKAATWGEADKILTIFTRNTGKVRAVAKGVRKITSRRGANVELFNHAKLFFHESKGSLILTEAETVTAFPHLKNDLSKIAYAYRLAEAVDQLFPERSASSSTFDLILENLTAINQATPAGTRLFSLAAGLKLFSQAGFRPQLAVCSRCGKALAAQTHLLSPEHGGLIDRGCNTDWFASKPISAEAIKLLRFLLDQQLLEVAKLNVPALVLKEASQATSFYQEAILDTSLRATKFIDRVESL